jgi:methionyl aminopeptidase
LLIVGKNIKIGITTKELDKLAYDYIISKDAYPTCLGFEGYPASICASVNEVVVHGIPNDYALKDGDIISIDLVVCYKGFNGDATRTFLVGNVEQRIKNLVEITKQCFFAGIKNLKAGDKVGQISHNVETLAKKHHYGIVRELVGHGIGREMHEDPEVPNYGSETYGPYLPLNSTIAIEPMITLGSSRITVDKDGWTVRTADGKPAAHYENTILIKSDGVEILTLTDEERECLNKDLLK